MLLLQNFKLKDIIFLIILKTPKLLKKLTMLLDTPKFSDLLSTQSLEKETLIEELLDQSKLMLKKIPTN